MTDARTSKTKMHPNANRKVTFGCFWQSGCSDSARCNAHGSCVAATQAGGAPFAQQMEPDTRPLSHMEILSAVAHHAREIARLTAALPVKCTPDETPAPPASAEGCATCGGSGWIGCECPVCTPVSAELAPFCSKHPNTSFPDIGCPLCDEIARRALKASEPPLPAGWVEHSRHGDYAEGRRGHESAMFHLHMLHRPPTVHYCNWVGRNVACCACGNSTRLPENGLAPHIGETK